MKRLSKLTPQETLAMAICIEGANAARHTIWADRFRPYNKEVSHVLEGLAQEDRLSQNKLKELFVSKYHKKIDKQNMPDFDKIVDQSNPDLEHFFVLDEDMSKNVMTSVLKAEYETLVFFQDALFKAKDENVKKIFKMLVDYEKQHVNELRETIEHSKNTIRKARTTEDESIEENNETEEGFFKQNFKNTKWQNAKK